MRELNRFRKVRDRNWVASRDGVNAASKRATPALTGAGASKEVDSESSSTVVDVTLPELNLAFKDFWAGLDSCLALHFKDERVRKRIAQEFDTLHYGALRTMNLEDINDACAMMAREVGCDIASTTK